MESAAPRFFKWVTGLLFLFAFVPAFAFAATQPPAANSAAVKDAILSEYAPPTGASLCTADLYQFGSVNAALSGSLTNVAQGAPIVFTGTLTNENAYPIPNAMVYVKVFKMGSSTKNQNGPDVVDFFPATSHLTIPAKGSVPYSFTWQVPATEQPGNYRVATFVVSSDRFNLLGLTFTDDVIGNTYDFSIVGQDVGAIRFDKATAFVDKAPYYFAVFPPVIPISQKSTPIQVSVKNTTNAPEKVSIRWSLYDWDSTRASNLISQSDTSVTVAAGSSTPVTYNLTDNTHTAYELIATIVMKDGTKSVAAFRIGRSGITTPRLNFVGATAYPATTANSAYACFQNEGVALSPNTKVTVTATRYGVLSLLGPIASATYTGSSAGQPFYAIKAPFHTAASSYIVTAQVYQSGKLIDSVSVPYFCKTLGGSCSIFDTWWPLIILIGVIVIILVIWYIVRSRRTVSTLPPPTNLPPSPPQP